MIYQVLIPCKPRKTPTMYESVVLGELPVGRQINASLSHLVSSPGKVDDGVVFIQDESTLYWLPLTYSGREYVKQIISVPPVTPSGVYPTEVVITSSDGSVYKATNFVKV